MIGRRGEDWSRLASSRRGVMIIIIIIITCDILTTNLADISNDMSARILQKTALLGTAHILRNFIS